MLSTLRTGSQNGRLTGLIHPLLVSIHSPTFRPPHVQVFAACFSSETPKEEREKTQKSETPKEPQDKHENKDPKGAPNIPRGQLLIALGSTAILCGVFASATNERVEEMMIQDVMKEYLMKGNVDSFEIVNRSQCIVHLRSDTPGKDPHTGIVTHIGSPAAFEAKVEAVQNEMGIPPLEHIPIRYVTRTSWMSRIFALLPIMITILPLLLIGRGIGSIGSNLQAGPRQILNFGKTSASVMETKSKTKFSDVAGLTEAKKEVLEFVEFLKNPEKFKKLGARLPKGALLAGPPGTGKTLLAKAIAGEADVPFLSMSGSDFVEMFVGIGSSRVRDLFKKARKVAPAIIFIDELDAVGRKRGSGGRGGNDERESTLNQLLVEMDGFRSDSTVIVIAGTNRADILDPALLRPGRFDRQIDVHRPDVAERAAIFMVHLKPLKLSDNLDVEVVSRRLAALTPGFVGADIASICNESAIFAARRNGEGIDMTDFENATDRVLAGLAKTNSLMSKETRRTVAVHESGHAVAGWFLQHADPLLKVTVVPRSKGALGFAQYLPSESGLFSAEALRDRIAVALGGRAAEELFVGEITSGAQDDLNKVTQMAYSMISELGMNKDLGLLSFKATGGFTKPYSEETGEVIDNEVRALIQEQYDRVKTLLTEKKDVLLTLSDRLLEKETLVFADLKDVMGERPFGVDEEYRKFVEQANPFSIEETKADATS